MFHHMNTDDVIQDIMPSIKQILKDDDEEVTLWNAVHLAVENHDKDILDMAREAEKRISERIMIEKKGGRGMYLKPWRYNKNTN